MSRIVILVLDGDLESGINVTLKQGRLLDDAVAITSQTLGKLRANPELSQLYRDWQKNYLRLEEICRTCRLPYRLELEKESEDIPPDYKPTRQHCEKLADELCQNMNHWLNSATDGFEDIRHKLAEQFQHPKIRFLVETKDAKLQRLPWHLWNLCQPLSESPVDVMLSSPEYREIASQSWGRSIRILAILGNCQGINIQTDKAHLQRIAGSYSCFLEQPTRQELEEKLRDREGWDILFFAGHSHSNLSSDRGKIHINANESLSLLDLKNAFGTAIKSRLKLAIFNSCDGLGLANELSQLNIPEAIVMKEPIPDEAAHVFLEFFLKSFQEGKPIHQAIEVATKRLESIENKLPYATWLPIVHQHPCSKDWNKNSPIKYKFRRYLPLFLLITSGLFILAIAFIYYQRHFLKTCPLSFGDRISCGEEIVATVFSNPTLEEAFKALKDSKWQEAVNGFSKSWNGERRDPETLIYWNNALLELTNTDYYTIAIIVPTKRDDRGTVVESELAEDLLRGVAQLQTEVNLGIAGGEGLPGRDFLKGGSINGKGLRVVIADDGNQLNTVKPLANALVQQSEILGIVGFFFSEFSAEAIDTFNRNKTVLISPSNTSPGLTKPDPDYYFRVMFKAPLRARKTADYLIEQGKKKAILYSNPQNSSSLSFRAEFIQYFTDRGGQIINEVNIAQPVGQFNAEATIPNVDNPDEIALVLAPRSSPSNESIANVLSVVRANRDRHLIIGLWELYARPILDNLPELISLKNLALVGSWNPASSPNRQFPEQAKQLWGEPVKEWTAAAYDAAKSLVRAIELQEKPTREGTQKILASPNFKVEGATGTVQFDRLGDRNNLPAQVFHLIPCPKEKLGVTFAPIQFDTAEAAGIACNN